MDIGPIYRLLQKISRPDRMKLFVDRFVVPDRMTILDIGGTPEIWGQCSAHPRVTFLNRSITWPPSGFNRICGDATALPFASGTFDIAFSNSVIEHLENWPNQQKMADEIRRVARSYFVQTPNFWFPIEPHYLAPCVHYVPRSIRPFIVRWLTPRGWIAGVTRKQAIEMVEEISLLTEKQMRTLFPDAAIYREKFAGLTKSIIAYCVGSPRKQN